MMRTLAFVSSKGGSGKSTLAACVAAAAAGSGRTVVLIDTDAQGSLAAWGRRRTAEDIVHRTIDPADLSAVVKRIQGHGGTDLLIIDTAGVAGTGAILAAQVADLVIVPVRPTLTDLDAMRGTVDALRRIEAPFAFVVSQVPTGALDRAREAARALVPIGRVAPAFTASRVAYADALADGTGVTESDPKGRAAEEIAKLWVWIDTEMGKSHGA